MKKIKTYGRKQGKREIRLSIHDRFDDSDDDKSSNSGYTTFLFKQTTGWSKLPRSSVWANPKTSDVDNSDINEYDAAIEKNGSQYQKLQKRDPLEKITKDKLIKDYTSSTPYVGKKNGSNCASNSFYDVSSFITSTDKEIEFDKNSVDKSQHSDLRIKPMKFADEIIDLSNIHKYESPILYESFERNSSSTQNNKTKISRMLRRSINYENATPNNKSRVSFLEALTPFEQGEEQSVHNLESKIVDESYQLTGKDRVLNLCEQEYVLDISEYLTKRVVQSAEKIGEGSYGEVFRATNSIGLEVVLKIVPVEGEIEINGGKQATFTQILPEIAISRELSSLRNEDEDGNQSSGFINAYRTVCCKGSYPGELLEEWDTWDEEHGSENDSPECLGEDQIFIVFEIEYGGQSLEHYPIKNVAEAKSLLHQVTAALAVGEKAFRFEHRDLHWGNVLISQSKNKLCRFQLEGCNLNIPTSGIQVKIIDFTLSRLENDGCVVYCNLSDEPSVFEGQGDYQFEIYRKMKDENCDSWEIFTPKSNIFWLHYLSDKLIKMKLKRRSTKLENFCKRILSYQSASELLCDEYFDY
eukprot:gene5636-6332_t